MEWHRLGANLSHFCALIAVVHGHPSVPFNIFVRLFVETEEQTKTQPQGPEILLIS
jgi:hypothetical protein